MKFNKFPNFGKTFSFPENADFSCAAGVHSITQKMVAQFVDDFDDYIVSQIANTARENGISELVVLNKSTIMGALNKQVPKKPTDIAKSELYGNCAVEIVIKHRGAFSATAIDLERIELLNDHQEEIVCREIERAAMELFRLPYREMFDKHFRKED